MSRAPPSVLCTVKTAPIATHTGFRSEIGEPVTMLPASEATLRIWRPAKYFSCSRTACSTETSCGLREPMRRWHAFISSVSVTAPPTCVE